MSCSSIRIEIVDIKTLQGLASGEDRRDHGVVCRGDHHQPVQRSGREEALEGSRSHTRHGTGGGVAVAHESWVKGSLLALASCICWSIWIILQVPSLACLFQSSYSGNLVEP